MAKDLNFSLLFDFYRGLLSEQQQNMLDLYYNEDLSLAEISEHTSMTRQGVRDHLKRAEAALTNAEQALGMVSHNAVLQQTIAHLEQEMDALQSVDGLPEQAEKHLQRMRALLGNIKE